MRMLLICGFALALACCHKPSQTTANRNSAAPQAPVKGPDRTHKGQAEPSVTFDDPNGHPATLKAFAGKPTLVNLWASWCAPCVKELPTLDQLARAQNGKLNVIAISQDQAPHASVVAFLQKHDITTLQSYQDPKMALSGALGVEVLPTSILYDAQGHELWRYVGDEVWTSAEAAKLLGDAGVSGGR